MFISFVGFCKRLENQNERERLSGCLAVGVLVVVGGGGAVVAAAVVRLSRVTAVTPTPFNLKRKQIRA